jgi:hypothetical protein
MPIQARRPRPAGTDRGNSFANVAVWLLFAVVGLTALTLAFVHAPGRIKLIGIYDVIYGLAAGWALGLLARKLQLTATSRLTAVTFVLIAAGISGVAIESHRVWAAREWEAFTTSPTGRLANEVLAKPDAPAELRASLQESLDNQRSQISFEHYLARRLAPLGNWDEPWPAVFWLAEIGFAALFGCFAFRKEALPLNAVAAPD